MERGGLHGMLGDPVGPHFQQLEKPPDILWHDVYYSIQDS